ncbi:MAG: phosphotransferase [Pseudonocardia sp.]
MELTNHDGTTLMITPGTSSPHSQITAEPGRGRFLIGIDNHLAPGSYDFDLSMPAGARAVTSADGGVDILDTTGQTVQSIAAPWAKDANGVQLPTRFEVIDNGDGSTTLRQHVAFDEATAFPVLADPAKKTSGSKKTDGKKTDGKKAPAKDKAPAKPAEEKPAGDKPAEKSPAGGKPAEEKPAGDKPVEDKPAAEKAAEEKPATAAAPDEQRDPAAAPPVPEEPADTIDGQPKFTFADDTGATDTTVTNADHPQVPGAPGMPEEPAPGPPGCFGGTCEPGAIPGLLPGAVEVPAAGAGTLPPGAPPHLGPLLDPRPSAAPGAPAVPGLLPGAVPVEPVLPIGGVPGTSLDPVLGQPGASVPLAPGAPFRADAPAPLTGSGPAQDEGWGPSDWGHLALDVLGLVPLLGEPADLANAAWYEAEGDHLNAGLSLAGAIPGLGWGATGGKLLGKGVQLLDSGSDATRIADAARATDNATPPAPRPGLPTAPSGTPPPLPGANAIPLLRGLTAADNLLGDTPPTNTPSGTPTTPDTVPTTPGTQPDVDTPTVRDPDHDRPTAPTRPDGVQPLPRGDRYIDGVTYRWDDDNQRWNPIAWEHGATPDHTGHPLDDRLRGASTTPGDSGSTGFRESDRDEVDAALGLAAATRTPTGGVDPAALRELMDSLPEPGDALAQFAAQSVGSPEVTLVPVGGEGAVGYSGAPVNLILGAGGEVLGVLKVFPRAEEFARELSALQRLGSLTQVGGVLPLGVARTAGPAGGGVLVSSAAPGRGIDQLMLEVGRARGAERAAKFADLRDTISAAGRALADLHAAGGASGTPPSLFIQRHVDAMRDIAAKLDSNQGLLAEEAGIDTTELRHRVEQLIAQLRANPGGSAIVHGDAHPGNLFYDPAAGITMIDTPTLHLSLDAEGAPIGAPARDVAYLAHKLAYFGPGWGLEPDEVIELQQVFRQAYADGGGAGVTAEAEAFFRARAALGELITSVNRAERLKEYAALRSRAALFRDALGVKDVSSAG